MTASVLVKFLRRAAYVALSARTPATAPLTFVMGNEGGDIDSVVSAIYTALLLSPNWDQPTFIPVVNFPRADLRLRGDIYAMLRDHGVGPADLLFEEQLFGQKWAVKVWGGGGGEGGDHHGSSASGEGGSAVIFTKDAKGKEDLDGPTNVLIPPTHCDAAATTTSGTPSPSFTLNARNPKDNSIILEGDAIVLTDHNVLRKHHQELGWGRKVVGIIDHHADEALYDGTVMMSAAANGGAALPPSLTPLKRIDAVGSATSLVALLWEKQLAAKAMPAPPPAPLLFLCPISMDTGNFKTKKNTPSDEAARDFLLPFIVEQCTSSSCVAGAATATESPQFIAIKKAFAATGTNSDGANSLFDRLKALKDDISTLTVPETLRRDYKRFALAKAPPSSRRSKKEEKYAVGISAILLTKKQCRKLYADQTSDGGCEGGCDEATAAARIADDDGEDEDAADAKEDDDVEVGGDANVLLAYPTDVNNWLPSIAQRMHDEKLDVYMNMFNKKGRELEVIYRCSGGGGGEEEGKGEEPFEAVWDYFLQQTHDSVQLKLKKRFKAISVASADQKKKATSVVACRYPPITVKSKEEGATSATTLTLKQVVYRQKNTHVSRKNFTPYLVDVFAAYERSLLEKEETEEMKSDL